VQFTLKTRTASSGALKKIGGRERSVTLETHRPIPAGHFFFANGPCRSRGSVSPTTSPLEERIRESIRPELLTVKFPELRTRKCRNRLHAAAPIDERTLRTSPCARTPCAREIHYQRFGESSRSLFVRMAFSIRLPDSSSRRARIRGAHRPCSWRLCSVPLLRVRENQRQILISRCFGPRNLPRKRTRLATAPWPCDRRAPLTALSLVPSQLAADFVVGARQRVSTPSRNSFIATDRWSFELVVKKL